MRRTILGLFTVLALAVFTVSRAAEQEPAETWKLTFFAPRNQQATLFLVKLQARDGNWTGELVDSRMPG